MSSSPWSFGKRLARASRNRVISHAGKLVLHVLHPFCCQSDFSDVRLSGPRIGARGYLNAPTAFVNCAIRFFMARR